MLIEFDSERVSLDIPTTGITTEGDTWKIIPLFPPEVKLVYYNTLRTLLFAGTKFSEISNLPNFC